MTNQDVTLQQNHNARIASLEEVIQTLINAMGQQNAAIGAAEMRLNSLELSRKKQPDTPRIVMPN